MFGRITPGLGARIVLFLFCCLIVKLYMQQTITMYIHPRYMVFALVMALLGGALLLIGLLVRPRGHKHHTAGKGIGFIDIIVVLVLLAAFVFPPKALSTSTVERKAITTSSSTSVASDQPCPDFRPETMDMWVFAASEYPHCYEGKEITITGFVYQPIDSKLPSDMYYLGRVVMSCCVIDARPYTLPVKQGTFGEYAKDTWLAVTGKLEKFQIDGKTHLVIAPTSIQIVPSPDQPYEFLNGQGIQPKAPLEFAP